MILKKKRERLVCFPLVEGALCLSLFCCALLMFIYRLYNKSIYFILSSENNAYQKQIKMISISSEMI